MNESPVALVALTLGILLAGCGECERRASVSCEKHTVDVSLLIEHVKVTEKTLELRYQIRNESEGDIWVLNEVGGPYRFESYLFENTKMFLIRRRLDIPANISWGMGRPRGKYVRLPRNESQIESIRFRLPLHAQRVYQGSPPRQEGIQYATRLAVEIGYWATDLPQMVTHILATAKKTRTERSLDPDEDITVDFYKASGIDIEFSYAELYWLRDNNKQLSDGSDEVIFPYTDQMHKGECFVADTVHNLILPYEEVWGPDDADSSIERRPMEGARL